MFGAEFLDGRACGLQGSGVETAPAVSSLWSLREQPCINQNANVFRYDWLAQLELGGELRNCELPPSGQSQDFAARVAR
jgi:hypothetical protein